MLRKDNALDLACVLNATDSLFYLTDTRGILSFISDAAAKRLGHTRGEVIGTNIFDYYSPELSRQRKDILQRVFSSGQPVFYCYEENAETFQVKVFPITADSATVTHIAVTRL